MPYRQKPATGSLFGTSPPTRPDEYLIAHVDGGARGNPGPAAYGVVITDQAGKPMAELTEYLGQRTNNYAEYSGMIAAMDYAARHATRALRVVSDSELMVKQMRGEYKMKSPALKELFEQARVLERQLQWFRIEHVFREKNREADRLVNETLDRAASLGSSRHHG